MAEERLGTIHRMAESMARAREDAAFGQLTEALGDGGS